MFAAVVFQEGTAMGGSKTTKLKSPTVVLVYIFTAFRLLFVALYVNKVQPFRSMCFVFSQLCVMALGIIAIIGAGQLAAE